MTRRSINLSDPLHEYLLEASLREHPVLRRLRDETASMANSSMQIAPEQGQFMAFVVETLGARRTLEIGTFTGYSALVVALALPDDGTVVACDVSEEWTDVARRYWAEAGIAHKIDLRLGPALETLDAMLEDGEAERFDFAFIDADKEPYEDYYERALRLLRPGGIAMVDNTLWSGRVADPDDDDDGTEIMRAFNAKLKDD
ncbi:MAG: class I SAM-dependent methyltransferase, partial [Gemmatimonadota bacterium]